MPETLTVDGPTVASAAFLARATRRRTLPRSVKTSSSRLPVPMHSRGAARHVRSVNLLSGKTTYELQLRWFSAALVASGVERDQIDLAMLNNLNADQQAHANHLFRQCNDRARELVMTTGRSSTMSHKRC